MRRYRFWSSVSHALLIFFFRSVVSLLSSVCRHKRWLDCVAVCARTAVNFFSPRNNEFWLFDCVVARALSQNRVCIINNNICYWNTFGVCVCVCSTPLVAIDDTLAAIAATNTKKEKKRKKEKTNTAAKRNDLFN